MLAKKPTPITTTLDTFNPKSVDFQYNMLYNIKKKFKYDLGPQIILCSGAVGSGKTLMAAHLIWLHAVENPGAYIGIGRKDLKRLKSTLLKPILAHAPTNWKVNKDFEYNKTEGIIKLPNGSIIACFSWADGDLERFKGEQFTMFVMDEGSESEFEVFEMIKSRLGRVKAIDECIFMILTNPDEPEHWINKDIIAKSGWVDGKKVISDLVDYNFHVYYSLTIQNKHNLKEGYIEGLIASNHKKWIERNLEGKWISFGGEGLYFAYDDAKHFFPTDYTVDLNYPIHVAWDFNVAIGKPMSVCFFQYINDVFHFFEQSVVQANTSSLLSEMNGRNLFSYKTKYIINGDAAGWHKGSATEGFSDYDIIDNFLKKLKIDQSLNYTINVPLANPEVKTRHNLVNSYLENGLGQHKIKVYKKCYTLNEGLKLTKLKDGGKYIEDDSKPYQHITTAAGYGIIACVTGKAKASVLKF